MTTVPIYQFSAQAASGGDFTNHSRSSSADYDNVLHNFSLGIFFRRFSLFMQSSRFRRWVNVVSRHGALRTKL